MGEVVKAEKTGKSRMKVKLYIERASVIQVAMEYKQAAYYSWSWSLAIKSDTSTKRMET